MRLFAWNLKSGFVECEIRKECWFVGLWIGGQGIFTFWIGPLGIGYMPNDALPF